MASSFPFMILTKTGAKCYQYIVMDEEITSFLIASRTWRRIRLAKLLFFNKLRRAYLKSVKILCAKLVHDMATTLNHFLMTSSIFQNGPCLCVYLQCNIHIGIHEQESRKMKWFLKPFLAYSLPVIASQKSTLEVDFYAF